MILLITQIQSISELRVYVSVNIIKYINIIIDIKPLETRTTSTSNITIPSNENLS
jgi:hypothetical protein